MRFPLLILLTLCATLVNTNPLSPSYSRFSSRALEDVHLRFVTDSGVCETTPGVHQMSGYIEIGKNKSMWFWFFESRQSPETAPLTLWLNGGPGCSSMIGLFQENGPCHVNADGKTTTLNHFSWNKISNMLYIDQPVGTGFSFGTVTVNSTQTAAPAIWKAFQILFESGQFAKYKTREFIFATESYGGHYGPAFVTYFDKQNALIAKGKLKGELIKVAALMINDGWFDPLLQNKAYVDFATHAPGYGQLQNDTVIAQINDAYYRPGGCRDQEEACYAAGNTKESNKICQAADDFCNNNVGMPSVGDRDYDDLRQKYPSDTQFPSEIYVDYLHIPEIMKKIGAEAEYTECPDEQTVMFSKTGDDARSLLPTMSRLANSRLKILIWVGDTDIICNWLGVRAAILAMDWYGNKTLHETPLRNMTIGGKVVAEIQNVDNFSFALVHESGHEIPAFQPKTALEIFSQVVRKEQLHSI